MDGCKGDIVGLKGGYMQGSLMGLLVLKVRKARWVEELWVVRKERF